MQFLVNLSSLVMAALLSGWAPGTFASADRFVNVRGAPAVPAIADPVDNGTNPRIDRLLAQPSDLWERIRMGFGMPDTDRALVAQQTAWYAERPELVQAIAQRARRYLHFIVDEVERRRLPTELALLPFIESGFNPMALSPAQASGLWQFIPDTGSKYKLPQSRHYDGRRDVIASTGAALDYLTFLYEYNRHDWHLALASYNWGEAAVGRAVERNRARGLPERYEDLSMPDETRNYVPRLLAIKAIVLDPAAYGVRLPAIPNEPFFGVVRVHEDLDLALAAKFAGMPLDDFLALNPAFGSGRASAATGPGMVIPIEKAEAFKGNLERYRDELARKAASRSKGHQPARTGPVTRF